MAIPAMAILGRAVSSVALLQLEANTIKITDRAMIIFFILVNFIDCCRSDVYAVDYMYDMHRNKRCCLTAQSCLADTHGFETETNCTVYLFFAEVALRANQDKGILSFLVAAS